MQSGYSPSSLQQKLGYTFMDLGLLECALTHRSLGRENYERLEFLGDSILGFVVARWLLQNYADLSEGHLSRMRARVVRQSSLAKIARELQLDQYLLLGEGERKSGGQHRDSILSDVVESIIGAIYSDGGMAAANTFIEKHFVQLLGSLEKDSSYKDAKSKLQELQQKQGASLPLYTVLQEEGADHQRVFTVCCQLVERGMSTQATASSRRNAEQKAAELMLNSLHHG